jgi:hypothetical protein
MKITVLLAAALLCVVCSTASYARPRHHSVASTGCSDPVMRPCGGMTSTVSMSPVIRKSRTTQRTDLTHDFVQIRENPVIKRMGKGLRRVLAEGAGRVVGGRPAGCPRAFCGCGASLYLFGKIVPALNLAANWLRFPRAEPAPGMVAARRGHVFVLVRHIRGPIWWAHDSNSGRHRTRVHPRSIAGFAIVNPRAGA